MENQYVILGIRPQASAEEITSAYRRCVRETHPNHNGTREKFHAVQAAYALLSDPDKRARYDVARRAGMARIGAVECLLCDHSSLLTNRSPPGYQDLFDRIATGSGWGPQDERKPGGRVRPVSTQEPATPSLRQLAREVLEGLHPSALPTVRKFFEPAQQDRALAVGVRAREKQAAGLPLSHQEKRLIGYYHSAAEVRKRWLAEGAKHIGTIDGVEFYT